MYDDIVNRKWLDTFTFSEWVAAGGRFATVFAAKLYVATPPGCLRVGDEIEVEARMACDKSGRADDGIKG